MKTTILRRVALAIGLLLAGVVVALGLLAVALDRGALRHPLMHVLSWQLGRRLAVGGALKLHLLSAHPQLEAEQVTLGNPPWMPPGDMGTARHLRLQFRWGRGIDGLVLEGAELNLLRDTQGFANWQFQWPDPDRLPVLPPLQALQATGVHLRLNDAQRRLQFDGSVEGGSQQGAALELSAEGTLNGRPAKLRLRGDPLATSMTGSAYAFEFAARGSGSVVDLKGSLPKPFEVSLFDASFTASGEDLKDLYLLTGLRFTNTGPFKFSGQIERRGTLTRFKSVSLAAGESDLTGSFSVETHGQRPRLTADLHSRVLRSVDLGPAHAGRAPDPDPPLFSRARLSLTGARSMDARIRWVAERLIVGRFVLDGVTTGLNFEQGVIDMPAFDAGLLGGHLSARAHLDATRDAPPVDVRFELVQGDLQALPLRTDNPPLTGPLGITGHLTGQGLSVHDVAASADGSMEIRVQRGTIRASIAELAGLDLRGLGLTLAGSQRETVLRCAVGRFAAAGGTLEARQLVIDTETVRIEGQGRIHLGDESLDLKLQGEPKQTRLLRLASPLLIGGTLRKPAVAPQTQGASLKLIDRGRAQDVDCGAL